MEKKMELEFVKMHGLGNDFIIMDDRQGKIQNYAEYSLLAERISLRVLKASLPSKSAIV